MWPKFVTLYLRVVVACSRTTARILGFRLHFSSMEILDLPKVTLLIGDHKVHKIRLFMLHPQRAHTLSHIFGPFNSGLNGAHIIIPTHSRMNDVLGVDHVDLSLIKCYCSFLTIYYTTLIECYCPFLTIRNSILIDCYSSFVFSQRYRQ